MSEHPSLAQIVERALGRGDRSSPLGSHLETCAACRDTAEWAAALAAAVAGGPGPAAPDALVERALAIPAAYPRSTSARSSKWSLARLAERALGAPALAGVRGSAGTRRALYEFPDGHVDLEISPDPEDAERFRIMGQILLREGPPEGAIAVLTSGEATLSRSIGDETGTFVFRRVPPGVYGVELVAPAEEHGVRIESLAVPPGAP